jgi:hypothetical protein
MHNERSSAPTSPNGPRREVELSEADYLAREVTEAKAALTHSLTDLKLGLANGADLRQWVKHYPWASLGAALAAGFSAAAVVTPAPGESVTDKLSRLRSDGQPSSNESSAPQQIKSTNGQAVTDKLIGSLFDLAKVLVQSLIVAAFRPPASKQNPDAAPPESQTASMAN